MRLNNTIELQKKINGGYNPNTGQYDEDSIVSRTYSCNITQVGIEKQLKIFGNFDKNALIVRILNYDGFQFNACAVNGKKYNIKKQELKNNNNLTLLVVESNG